MVRIYTEPDPFISPLVATRFCKFLCWCARACTLFTLRLLNNWNLSPFFQHASEIKAHFLTWWLARGGVHGIRALLVSVLAVPLRWVAFFCAHPLLPREISNFRKVSAYPLRCTFCRQSHLRITNKIVIKVVCACVHCAFTNTNYYILSLPCDRE